MNLSMVLRTSYLSYEWFSYPLFPESEIRYSTWKKAVMKSMGWVTTQSSESGKNVFIIIATLS